MTESGGRMLVMGRARALGVSRGYEVRMMDRTVPEFLGRLGGSLLFSGFGYFLGLVFGGALVALPLRLAGRSDCCACPGKQPLKVYALFFLPYLVYALLLSVNDLNKSLANASLVEPGLTGLLAGVSYMLQAAFFPKKRKVTFFLVGILCLLAWAVWAFMPFVQE